MDLVIKILEYLEEREDISVIKELEIPGYDNSVVAYHVKRMYEGGLLDAEAITSKTTDARLIDVLPCGLTWQGHDFIVAIRSEGVAQKVRQRLGGSLGQVPFILVKELALFFCRQQFGL